LEAVNFGSPQIAIFRGELGWSARSTIGVPHVYGFSQLQPVLLALLSLGKTFSAAVDRGAS
jgi:hypothetical protein